MGVKIQWQGLSEFKQALQNLPEHLTDEASEIVISAAKGAASTVQSNYPRRTGNLKRGVKVTTQRDKASVSARVISGAPHSIIYEKGTRRRRTDKGWNRGAMPPAPTGRAMIPTVIRARELMVQRLIDLLQREGLLVTR